MLQHKVYIQSVNNLSDARYCAGMGVQFLGFDCNPINHRYVGIDLVNAIKGWISGIEVIAECVGMNNEDINNVINALNPEYLLVESGNDFAFKTPLMYLFDLDSSTKKYPPFGSKVVLEGSSNSLNNHHSLIKDMRDEYGYQLIFATGVSKDSIPELFHTYQAFAIALKGGNESAPGLKSFDELADILEFIEVNN
ncbi:MAG: hypothetical protein SFY32_03040 [Bacteroidota bacterium]|nr:hypothetical protein [Bacteroidota bacterium]